MDILSKDNNLRIFGDFRLDIDERVLWHRGRPVDIQMKEIEILEALTESPGRLVTKQQIIERVWPDAFVEESNLSRHIYRLRRMFKELGESGKIIQTVPRRGYRFVVPVVAENTTFTVERHSITKTLIEEIEQSDPPDPPTRPRGLMAVVRSRRLPLFATVGLAVTLLMTGALGFLAMRSYKPTSEFRPGSLAVLPFRSATMELDDGRFGHAIAESVTVTLGRQNQMIIRPVSPIKDSKIDRQQAIEIGREIQADAVLIGEYTNSENTITLKAELVRVSDGSVAWTSETERSDGDFFKLQESLAFSLARSLAIDVSGGENGTTMPTLSVRPDAQKLYMQGRYFWSKRDYDSLAESQRLFKAAINADPSFALAYVGLADATMFREDPSDSLVAVNRAIELDPNIGEAYATRGFIKMFHFWEWDAAEADLKRAIEMSPNHGSARQWYGLLLAFKRRFDEAEMQLNFAVQIDPTSPNFLTDLGLVHYFSREFVSAEAACRDALRLDERFPFAHGCLSDLYLLTGDHSSMVRHGYIATTQTSPGSSPVASRNVVDRRLEELDQRKYLELLIRQVETTTDRNGNRHIAKARAEFKLGFPDRAIASLNRAVDERAFLSPYLNSDPIWDPLRGRQEFKDLVARLGL
ncbi:MAG: winged helix-turn-helix domain-containing protein [Acidobacteria bacterium]|nr:winged helix-turn-helix domain-containing protein [Acidobacteriota bacterium]